MDKDLIEVFLNDRQAALYMHRHDKDNTGVRLFSKGGDIRVKANGWKMKSIYTSRYNVRMSSGFRVSMKAGLLTPSTVNRDATCDYTIQGFLYSRVSHSGLPVPFAKRSFLGFHLIVSRL